MELDAERGCTFISVAIIAAMVGGLVYFFVSDGDPEVKNFRNACVDRHVGNYGWSDLPDNSKTEIIVQCERELKEYLRLRRQSQH